MLPDADRRRDPDLILIDIADDGRRRARRARVPRRPTTPPGAGRPLGPSAACATGWPPRSGGSAVRRHPAVLAVGSAIFFDVVAGLTPLDAISYAITLLTGASLPAEIDSASAQRAPCASTRSS